MVKRGGIPEIKTSATLVKFAKFVKLKLAKFAILAKFVKLAKPKPAIHFPPATIKVRQLNYP